MQFTKNTFGYTKGNDLVSLYHLENSSGSYIEVLDYGCRFRSICVPDKNGVLQDVCLAYPRLSDYETDDAYFGAAVGRCANLIHNAHFSLNGKTYLLDKNDGSNHLHGGKYGFSFCFWNGAYEDGKLIFTRHFPDQADGYPGNLDVKISYGWTEDNRLNITYEAVSDKDTIFNVTNHTYFNLEGAASASVLEHELWLASSSITEVMDGLLPTGNYLPVEGTPFDFRIPKLIGKDINDEHEQLTYGCGYDHNFVLKGDGFRKAAILQSPNSGIRMTCYTDQPGIQVYTSNGLEHCKGKYGETLEPRSGICLETQHYTNSIQIPAFPSVVLKANTAFLSNTTYAFDTI